MVNDHPTKNFNVDRGLRKGDPLSFFLLVGEVLASLINKAAELGNFSVFKVNDKKECRLIQYVDDMVLIGRWN